MLSKIVRLYARAAIIALVWASSLQKDLFQATVPDKPPVFVPGRGIPIASEYDVTHYRLFEDDAALGSMTLYAAEEPWSR